MPDIQLVLDLVLAVTAAFIGGLVAQRLGQPVIIGYLLAGVLIGPFAPGPRADIHSVQVLAELGVAFLMFAVGTQFAIGELRHIGRVVTLGGPLQILLTMALGPLVAPLLGLSLTEGLFLGGLLALSSTVVALKVLMQRGELQALHGRLTVGIAIVQDVAFVPMVVLLPLLGTLGRAGSEDVALTILKAAAVVVGVYVIGAWAMPWVLDRTAAPRVRELFLLGVVAIALGTAVLTEAVGLSLAFGAFLAGMVIGETEHRAHVLGEVVPFRDVFASLFFVSIGMLVDPLRLAQMAGAVALLTAVLVVGKFVVVSGLALLLGMPGRVAILAGLALANIGEFSFVLGRIGVDAGAVSSDTFDLMLTTAVLSIVISPFLLRAAPGVFAVAARVPGLGARLADPAAASGPTATLRRHAVICGYGRIGQELATALESRGLRYAVVEYNPEVVDRLRERGVPVVFGDAANPAVLEHARLAEASLLAVLMPDALAAELTTARARQLHPRLDIVARAIGSRQVERLMRAGASDVVQPEFEAGIEVIRHALRRYGIGGQELTNIAAGRRRSFYRHRPRDDVHE